MGAIGRELIRMSKERIIHLKRTIEFLHTRGGYKEEINRLQDRLDRERSALREKIELEGGE